MAVKMSKLSIIVLKFWGTIKTLTITNGDFQVPLEILIP